MVYQQRSEGHDNAPWSVLLAWMQMQTPGQTQLVTDAALVSLAIEGGNEES
jgi:hypothetical protein